MLFLNKHNKHILLKLMLFLNKHNKHTFETYVLSGLFVLIKCVYVCVGEVSFFNRGWGGDVKMPPKN